jgi:hypothetical protein
MKKKPPAVVSDPLSPPYEKSVDAALMDQVNTLLTVAATPDPLRMTRHFEWLSHPNVTMAQACWILLGFDHRRPPADHGLSDASPSERHKRLVDRLQCEVAAKKLKPVRATRAAREDRFRLLEVAARSRDLGMAFSIANELFDVARQRKIIASKPESLPERISKRMEWHRQFVASIPDNKKKPVPAKAPRKHPRRANPGAPINVWLAMIGPEYDQAFTKFADHQFGRQYVFESEMLKADRRALNVQLKAGHHPPPPIKAKPQK